MTSEITEDTEASVPLLLDGPVEERQRFRSFPNFTRRERVPKKTVPRPPPLSFFNGYTIHRGVPTFPILPREDDDDSHSQFCVPAMSDDGTLLAVGETNGRVRWDHPDLEDLFSRRIRGVSFLDGKRDQIVVLEQPNVLSVYALPCIDSCCYDKHIRPAESSSELLPMWHHILPDCGEAKTVQFSTDGRVVALRYDQEHIEERSIQFRVISHDLGSLSAIALEDTVHLSLSEDGEKAMGFRRKETKKEEQGELCSSVTYDPPHVLIWTNLRQHLENYAHLQGQVPEDAIQPTEIRGDFGRWGGGGEYALIWSTNERLAKPLLKIYRLSGSKRIHVASRVLGYGLSSWDARFLDTNDHKVLVAIYEIYNKKGRFVIWDVKHDEILKEIGVDLEPSKCLKSVPLQTACSVGEHNGVIPTAEIVADTYQWYLLRSSYPNFDVSDDRSLAAFFDPRNQSVHISSLISGVKCWSCQLPFEVTVSTRGCGCLLDKSGTRLLIFSREAIFVFVPPCLDLQVQPQRTVQNMPWSRKFTNEEIEQWAQIAQDLPIALSKWVCKQLALHESAKAFNIPGWQPRFGDGFRVEHSAISPTGDKLAFIVRTASHDRCLFLAERPPQPNHNAEETPSYNAFKIPTIDVQPRLAFLNKNVAFVLLRNKCDKYNATFISTQMIRPVVGDLINLNIELLPLASAQSSSRRFVYLLSDDRILVFDLTIREQMDSISFKTDFETLLKRCNTSEWWDWLRYHRKISDDGKTVLIGWDRKNGRAVLTTPETELQDAMKQIEDAGEGGITSECTLTCNAEWVVYLDPDALQNGRLVVGVAQVSGGIHRRIVIGNVLNRGSSYISRGSFELKRKLRFHLSSKGDELAVVSWDDEDEGHEQLIRVTTYASERHLPSHSQLKASCANNSALCVKEAFEKYGADVFNMPHPPEKSLFIEALLENGSEMQKEIRRLSVEHKFDLSIAWGKTEAENEKNPAAVSMKEYHPICEEYFPKQRDLLRDKIECIQDIRSCFVRCSATISEVFLKAWMKYPRILESVLNEEGLVVKACDLDVHPDFFSIRTYQGVYLETADTALEWFLMDDQEKLNKNWRQMHSEKVRKFEKDGDTAVVRATLKIVRLANIARTRQEGILRRVLIKNPDTRLFELNPIKWTVLYKWETYWKWNCGWSMAHYLVLVAFFSWYAVAIGGSHHKKQEMVGDLESEETMLLVICWVLALPLLREEFSQFKNLAMDAKKCFSECRAGVNYYFRCQWNWVQLVSFTTLLLFIPFFHILSTFRAQYHCALAVCVAAESILIWFKIWYHLQAFEVTGALVLMIGRILQGSLYFLLLAFMILIGYSLAFLVLFKNLPIDETTEGYQGTIDRYFGTIARTMVTLYFALFANFPIELYLPRKGIAVMISGVFALYIFFETILLLNLLIAIMGDAFDRIKSKEKSQLLRGRAMYMDACEACMSKTTETHLKKLFGTYLLVLEPHEPIQLPENEEWRGRMNEIIYRIRKTIQETLKQNAAERPGNAAANRDEGNGNAAANEDQPTEIILGMKRNLERMQTQLETLMQQMKQNSDNEQTEFSIETVSTSQTNQSAGTRLLSDRNLVNPPDHVTEPTEETEEHQHDHVTEPTEETEEHQHDHVTEPTEETEEHPPDWLAEMMMQMEANIQNQLNETLYQMEANLRRQFSVCQVNAHKIDIPSDSSE